MGPKIILKISNAVPTVLQLNASCTKFMWPLASHFKCVCNFSQDSSVDIVTGYLLDNRRTGVRVSVE